MRLEIVATFVFGYDSLHYNRIRQICMIEQCSCHCVAGLLEFSLRLGLIIKCSAIPRDSCRQYIAQKYNCCSMLSLMLNVTLKRLEC